MKLSKYLVIKKIENDFILFSTISKTIIKVNSSFFEEMKNNKLNNDNLKCITKNEFNFLKENFFLINDDIDERKIVEYSIDKDRLDQKIFSSYIAFSTLCNFSCIYCYEEGQTCRNKIMDKFTLKATIKWYKKILKKNNYKECRINLFGGEPLLHKDLIKILLSEIKEYTNQNNIKLNVSIITNGYLLDNKTIRFLNSYGLEEIQITLDGVGTVHDKRRPLKNGNGTFDVIIKNIKNSTKFNGRFLFRVSFDDNNIKNIKETIKYLATSKIENNFDIYLAPIHQTTNQKNQHCSFCSKNVYKNEEIIINKYIELYTYMNQLEMKVPKYYTNGPCMVVSNDTVLVDPYGDLYKCVEMISIKNLCIGNVKDNNYNQKYYDFVGKPLFKNCINNGCKYVTLCGGGCLMQSYLNNKKLTNLNCEFEYFEKLIPFFLEVNYGKIETRN